MYSLTQMIHNYFATEETMTAQTNLYKEFGNYLRRYREAKGLGLREVARRADISHTYLSQVERGEPRNLSEEKLISLATALAHSHPEELFAKAGRLRSEVEHIIKQNPAWSEFILASRDLSSNELTVFLCEGLESFRALGKQLRRKKSAEKKK